MFKQKCFMIDTDFSVFTALNIWFVVINIVVIPGPAQKPLQMSIKSNIINP